MVSEAALTAVQPSSVMEVPERKSAAQELTKVINVLAEGKAPSKVEASQEIIKCVNGLLLKAFHEFLCLRWKEGVLTKNRKHSNIIIL